MKAKIEIDIDDVIAGMSSIDVTQLAKDLSKDHLDIKEMIQVIHDAGYSDNDILDEIDLDDVVRHLSNNGYKIVEDE